MFHEFDDVPSAAEAMPGLDLNYRQLQAGRAKVEIDFHQMAEVTVVRAGIDRRAGGSGQVKEGRTLFLLCTHASSAHVYNGLPLTPGSLFIIRGGVAGRQTLQSGFGGIHFLLPDELLRQHQRLEPASKLEACAVVQVSQQERAVLLDMHSECARTDLSQARHMADRIVSSLCEISVLESVADLPLHTDSRTKLARRVQDLLENCPELTLGDMCSELMVSERTVRRAFTEYFGMGPCQYQLTLRLNKVREALSDCAYEHGAVSQVATQYGFWHMGRFSTQYRRLFGETPIATLKRGSQKRGILYLASDLPGSEKQVKLAKNG